MTEEAKIELLLDTKNEELSLDKVNLLLTKYDSKIKKEEQRKQIVTIILEPKQNFNLHQKIEVRLITPERKKEFNGTLIIFTILNKEII